MGKHKPKCLFKGFRCSVTHNFQALSRCLFLPKAVPSFLHSIWAFPLYFSFFQPVGLCNNASLSHTSVSLSTSSETITQNHQLPPSPGLQGGAAGPCAADVVQGTAQALASRFWASRYYQRSKLHRSRICWRSPYSANISTDSSLTQTVGWWVVHPDIQQG